MRTITLAHPERTANRVRFAWTVDPPSELYRRGEFTLEFPPEIDLGRVPDAVWWYVAIVALQAHWLLLRPCTVRVPVRLPPGERDFWLRLLEVEANATDLHLELTAGHLDRTFVLEDTGEAIAIPPCTGDRFVAGFSGGKDSLAQMALLCEIGIRPILVAVNSTLPPHRDLEIPRRAEILRAIQQRRDVDLVEVYSDLRSAWENHYPRTAGFDTTVNELADFGVYVAAMIAVAYACGAPHLLLASELDSSASVERGGSIVLGRFFMTSALIVAALDRLLQRLGLRYSSAIMPLPSHQVGALLWTRYRDIADLQYSCWRATEERAHCSECDKCWGIAGWLVTLREWPGAIGLDLVHALNARRDWAPPAPTADAATPTALFTGFLAMRAVRMARSTSTLDMARFIARHEPLALLRPRGWRAIAAYRRIRARAIASSGLPIGYSPAFLRYVDPALHRSLGRIFADSFATDEALDAGHVERTERGLAFITKPIDPDPAGS